MIHVLHYCGADGVCRGVGEEPFSGWLLVLAEQCVAAPPVERERRSGPSDMRCVVRMNRGAERRLVLWCTPDLIEALSRGRVRAVILC